MSLSRISLMHNLFLLLVYFILLVCVYQDHQEDYLLIANKLVIPTMYHTTKLFLIYFDVDERCVQQTKVPSDQQMYM